MYRPQGGIDVNFMDYLQQNKQYVSLTHAFGEANIDAELPSVAKYAKYNYFPLRRRDRIAIDVAYQFLEMHFGPYMYGSQVVSNEMVWTEMNKTTSPGHPWNIAFSTKTVALESEWLKNYVEGWYLTLGKGENVPMWTSAVKAEMLPHEKIVANKRRTFTASSIEMTFGTNKLCLDQNARMFRAGSEHLVWSAVGFSMFKRGWHKLATRLKGKCRHRGFAFDASQYDSSIGTFLFAMVCAFRKRCLSNKHDAQVQSIYHHIVNSVIVLTDGLVVQKSTGNPSGSGNTTPDNTLVLFLLFAFSYIRRFLDYQEECGVVDPLIPSYAQYMEDCAGALYGDDSVLMCTDECLKWFSGQNIVDGFSVFGVTLTPEGDSLEPKPLHELTFLSQRFHYLDEYKVYVPVPHAEKVFSSMLVKKSVSIRMSLYRALALYLVAYWNPKCREILGGYIDYMMKRDWRSCIDATCTVEDVVSTYRTDKQVIDMWLGLEDLPQGQMGSAQEGPHLKDLSLIQYAFSTEEEQSETCCSAQEAANSHDIRC